MGFAKSQTSLGIIKQPELLRPELLCAKVCGQMMDSFNCITHHDACYDYADN